MFGCLCLFAKKFKVDFWIYVFNTSWAAHAIEERAKAVAKKREEEKTSEEKEKKGTAFRVLARSKEKQRL